MNNIKTPEEKQEPGCEHDKSVYWEKDLVNPESFPSRYERYFKKELPTCPFCPKKENKKLVSMEDVIRKLDIVLSKDAPLSHKIKTALLELL